MTGPILLPLLLQAASPEAGAEPVQPAASAAEAKPLVTMFFYARARYFHDSATVRGCDKVDKEQAGALKRRFDRALERLIARNGSLLRDFARTSQAAGQGADPGCASGFLGYGNAMHELERHMEKGGVP